MSAALSAMSAMAGLRCVTPAVPDEIGARSWWFEHHDSILKATNAEDAAKYKVVFLGDSITQLWKPQVWNENYTNDAYRAINLGFCGDRTEHVLWRIENGELGKLDPAALVLEIGTNNTWSRKIEDEPPGDTIYGIRMIVRKLLSRLPNTKIILHPIFPRGDEECQKYNERNAIINEELPRICDGRRVFWCDFNKALLDEKGGLTKEVSPDGVHPGEEGYRIWARELKPTLDYVLGYSDKRPEGCIWDGTDPCDPTKPRMSAWIDYRSGPKRCEIASNRSMRFDLVLIGDSITQNWEERGPVAIDELLGGKSILNLGFSGDKVENLLWGVIHGGYCDGYSARVICLMIGTNNRWCKKSTPEEIAEGIAILAKEIKKRQPEAKLLLSPIFPAGFKADDPGRLEVMAINAALKAKNVADGRGVIWFDLTDKLLNSDGTMDERLFPDGLHPADDGYNIWARELLKYL